LGKWAIDLILAAIDTNLAPLPKGAARLSVQADEVQVVTCTNRPLTDARTPDDALQRLVKRKSEAREKAAATFTK